MRIKDKSNYFSQDYEVLQAEGTAFPKESSLRPWGANRPADP